MKKTRRPKKGPPKQKDVHVNQPGRASWMLPLLLLLLVSPFTPWIDQVTAAGFYSAQLGSFGNPAWCQWMYDFAVIPALIIGISSAALLIVAYIIPSLSKWRQPLLFLVLTLTLGSGALINGTLKEYWGRPRPAQVESYGGAHAFRPFYSANIDLTREEPLRSFPCGHCSMGYFFFTFCILGRRYRKPALYWTGVIAAFGLGGALGTARIIQGGHFVSDVIVAALIMWLVALAVEWMVFDPQDQGSSKPSS